MRQPIELSIFAIAAITGLVIHFVFGSFLLSFVLTVISALFLYRLFSHFRPTSFFENTG